jgi:hypothetical protein
MLRNQYLSLSIRLLLAIAGFMTAASRHTRSGCRYEGDAKLRSLIKEAADVNAAHGDGMTFHWAAQKATELAQMLVYAGANVCRNPHWWLYASVHGE